MVEEKKILLQAEESLPSDLTKVKITRLTPQTDTVSEKNPQTSIVSDRSSQTDTVSDKNPQTGIVSDRSPQHVIFQAEDSLASIFRI